jgi:prophage regulatory protein
MATRTAIATTPLHSGTPRPLLRMRAVCQSTGLSRSQLYRRLRAGEFPQPVRLSKQAIAWASNEIQDWIDARVAERDAEGA